MTWVIAHRGASYDERENTLPAFERAVGYGVDFVELDVQASSDGVLVVFHDTTLDRLTPLRGPLRKRTAAELAEHDIPTLAAVVELVRGRTGVMAELKSPHLYRRHELVTRTVAALDPAADVVLSFQRWALQEARRASSRLRILQHVGYGVSINSASRYANAVGFGDGRVTERGLAKARSLDLATTVYTVNDTARMRELVALGVDGIFSDRPDRLQAVLRR
jgi:glycerophosphoryl diester phosphodiesterase